MKCCFSNSKNLNLYTRVKGKIIRKVLVVTVIKTFGSVRIQGLIRFYQMGSAMYIFNFFVSNVSTSSSSRFSHSNQRSYPIRRCYIDKTLHLFFWMRSLNFVSISIQGIVYEWSDASKRVGAHLIVTELIFYLNICLWQFFVR